MGYMKAYTMILDQLELKSLQLLITFQEQRWAQVYAMIDSTLGLYGL